MGSVVAKYETLAIQSVAPGTSVRNLVHRLNGDDGRGASMNAGIRLEISHLAVQRPGAVYAHLLNHVAPRYAQRFRAQSSAVMR